MGAGRMQVDTPAQTPKLPGNVAHDVVQQPLKKSPEA